MRISNLLLSVFLLTVIGCTSMYETGGDLRDDWAITSLTAANSAGDDIAPVRIGDALYFTSNRPVGGKKLDRMYVLQPAVPAGDVRQVRTSSEHIRSGAPAGPPDAQGHLLYVECYRSDGVGDCDLVEARLSDGGLAFENSHVLESGINDREWDHHPTLSADGSTLVFASERFGGHGGSDLWMSRKTGDTWSAPVNLSATINTGGNEITPWLSPDGSELYFSSDAHPGRGGFDIFVSRRISGAWSTPEPLGLPFNSGDDDIFFSGSLDADTVFLASNRTGGSGGYDLYRVIRRVPPPPPPQPKEKPLVLRVQAKNAYTMQDIPALVNISDTDDRELAEGQGALEIRMELGGAYVVSGELNGFMSAVETIRFGDVDEITDLARDMGERMTVTHDLLLVPVAEEERKIYSFTVEFDFNLFNIRPEEERKLDSVVLLLAQFPNSTVVLSGHTDSVGTVAYNIKLGYNRAQEVGRYVGDWLGEKGVTLQNPMEIRTYGKRQPVAPNSTAEGRQRNRRVEIAIVRNE
ncbi:MAG: PD40 domain-containing protein [Bacteroidetes bacterium]|nr:PD40 domain-containing protein [Bacteroidota bacterium]